MPQKNENRCKQVNGSVTQEEYDFVRKVAFDHDETKSNATRRCIQIAMRVYTPPNN